jgi:hypothetical protein
MCAADGELQSRETGKLRATRASFLPLPSHRWGRAAPRGSTVCAATCASRSRETGTLRAARALLSRSSPPPPAAAVGGQRRPAAPCAPQRARDDRARQAFGVQLALRPPPIPPPATAGGGLRRAAAPCAPPIACHVSARQARGVPLALPSVPPSDPWPVASPSRATGSAPDMRTSAVPPSHARANC